MALTATKNEFINLGNKTVTLDTLFEEADEIQKYCSDYTVSKVKGNVWFDSDTLNLVYLEDNDGVRWSPLSVYALSQLCVKLGIPYKYLSKTLDKGYTDLVASNINTWLSDYKGSFLVREYKNEIRGILSNRYCSFDTPNILEVLNSTLSNVADFQIRGHYTSPERFHLRLTDTQPLDIEGETLFCGYTIDSSDVGRKTLTISFFVYRQVCTNGLCISKYNDVLYSQKHLKVNRAEFLAGVTNSLGMFPELKDTTQKMLMGSMTAKPPVEFKVGEDEEFINKVQTNAEVSENLAKRIINVWNTNYGAENSMWAYANSLTEVARDLTLEERLNLERRAGNLIAVA